jgi:hypothetical protein
VAARSGPTAAATMGECAPMSTFASPIHARVCAGPPRGRVFFADVSLGMFA